MVTLEILESLQSIEPTENLQRLVNGSMSRLLTSFASVGDSQPQLASVNSPYLWLIADSRLCLDGGTWTITFADDGRRFKGVDKNQPLPTLESLTQRCTRFLLESVQLKDETRVITVERRDDDVPTQDVHINDLVDPFGITLVQKATVRNTSSITVEFDRRVARSDNGVKIPLAPLAEVAVALMAPSGDSEISELVRFLASVPGSETPLGILPRGGCDTSDRSVGDGTKRQPLC